MGLPVILTAAHVILRFSAQASGSQPRLVGAGSAGLAARLARQADARSDLTA